MIANFVRRIIGFLLRLGYIKKYWILEYNGKILSLNDLYKQGHWAIRANLKKKYKAKFLELLIKYNVKKCSEFLIIIFYNTRHDVDNLVGVSKILVDTMKGIVSKDDNKSYYKGLAIFPDGNLSRGSLEIYIIKKK